MAGHQQTHLENKGKSGKPDLNVTILNFANVGLFDSHLLAGSEDLFVTAPAIGA
jgi:hypothetical protein